LLQNWGQRDFLEIKSDVQIIKWFEPRWHIRRLCHEWQSWCHVSIEQKRNVKWVGKWVWKQVNIQKHWMYYRLLKSIVLQVEWRDFIEWIPAVGVETILFVSPLCVGVVCQVRRGTLNRDQHPRLQPIRLRPVLPEQLWHAKGQINIWGLNWIPLSWRHIYQILVCIKFDILMVSKYTIKLKKYWIKISVD